MHTADHISLNISPAFLKLSFSKSSSNVLPQESRCVPKESWGRTTPVSSRLSGAMRFSTLLKALLPEAKGACLFAAVSPMGTQALSS
ncbi:hypothetical protein KQX54_015952 [Cotesia glomerata]|uniref:Uncharacterized protein n=1 Tax=Cotesia glomerata TaxID=32391 RepID=A0AAV7IYT7_COTGL|nr:hypothetical protein KQX54_015952 [Cotesia glomerata]